jgi:hypothetical protein
MAQQSAMLAVLAAVYGVLNVSSLTTLATGGVHNGVPQTAVFPYVRLGEATESREDCMGQPGKDVLVRLHVFERGRTDAAVLAIVSKVQELLHYATFAVTNHTLVCSQHQQSYAAGTENINGVEARHYVVEVLVTVRQTA